MGSIKTRERLRRALGRSAPKLGVVLGGLAVLLAVAGGTGSRVRLVTINDSEGRTETVVTAARRLGVILRQAGVEPVGWEDEFEVNNSATSRRISVVRAHEVDLTADGKTLDLITTGKTVAEILAESGVALGADDEVEPALDAEAEDGMKITVRRVRYEEYTVQEFRPMETEYELSSLFYRSQDTEMLMGIGSDGEDLVTYRDRYVDGKWESKTEIGRETVTEMVPQVVKVYGERVPVSAFAGPEVVDGVPVEGVAASYTAQRSTGYSASPTAKGAAGTGLCYGTVAVNPNVIPYGSLMYIESADGQFVYGYAYASDTGTAMMTGHAFVDLFYDTYQEAVQSAVIAVNVYVLDEETAAKYAEENAEILQWQEEGAAARRAAQAVDAR